jgi:hypothetical protein
LKLTREKARGVESRDSTTTSTESGSASSTASAEGSGYISGEEEMANSTEEKATGASTHSKDRNQVEVYLMGFSEGAKEARHD